MRSKKTKASAAPPGSLTGPFRRTVMTVLVGLLSIGLVVTGAGISNDAAYAAAYGPGYDGANGHIGSYRVGSTNVYCLRPDEPRPTGATTFAGYQQWPGGASGPTMSALANARVNWAISTYGQRNDNNWASAVSMYVWSLADPTEYNSHGMSGDSWYIGRVPSAQRNTVLAYLAQLRAEQPTVVGSTGTGTGVLVFDVDEGNNYLGTVTVSSLNPSSATGTVTLTNGIFVATGTNVISGVTSGMTLDIQGVPPTDDGALYKVSGVGVFTNAGGWLARVGVYTTPGAQPLGGPGGQAINNFTITGTDPVDRSTVFQPALTTEVASKFIEPGQPFDDVVTFTTVPDADGLNNPWFVRESGNYEPIFARGTVYGPFLQQPVESDTVPVGAPVAGTATITTTLADGPTVPYTVTTAELADEAGFYTWVWEVHYDEQSARAQRLIPDGYSFVDRFGQVAETQISPVQVRFTTELTTGQAAVSDAVDDAIDVFTIGGWLRQDGSRIPVTLTGTAYWSASEPQVSDAVPSSAEPIGTYTVTSTGPGQVVSEDIAVGVRPGWVSLVWCVDPAEQPAPVQGMAAAWCDQYGLPSETVQVTAPVITTAAQPLATPGATVTDTAIVSGRVPAVGLDITFEGFLQPQDAREPICDASTLTFTSTEPIRITEAGEYTSEEFPVNMEHVGTLYWVETARLPDGTVIHVGECGLANETTEIRVVEVTTVATPEVELGDPARDIARLVGMVPPGATVTFNAYLQPEGELTQSGSLLASDGSLIEPICEDSNRVFDGTELPVAAPVGNFPDGVEMWGPWTTFTELGTYYWRETLRDSNAEILHQGECGAALETTIVAAVAPPLPNTGAIGGWASMWWWAGGFIAGGAGLLIGTAWWSRRRWGLAA